MISITIHYSLIGLICIYYLSFNIKQVFAFLSSNVHTNYHHYRPFYRLLTVYAVTNNNNKNNYNNYRNIKRKNQIKRVEGTGNVGRSSNIGYLHKGIVTELHPKTLLDFIIANFALQKRSQGKFWLSNRLVAVNEVIQTKFDFQLYKNDLVTISSNTIDKSNMYMKEISILANDKSIIVVDKPVGYSSSENMRDTPSFSLPKLLQQFLFKKYGNQSPPKLFPISIPNPIELSESGVCIYCKSVETMKYLSSNWENTGKKYVCVCVGKIHPSKGTLRNFIGLDSNNGNNGNNGHDDNHKDGNYKVFCSKNITNVCNKEAICHYETIDVVSSVYDESIQYSLVEITTETDTRHQIRAQLASLGYPIIGDDLYTNKSKDKYASEGNEAVPDINIDTDDMCNERQNSQINNEHVYNPLRRLGLHLSELRLTHPESRDICIYTAVIPTSFTHLFKERKNNNNISNKEDDYLKNYFRNKKNISEDNEDSNNYISGRNVRLLSVNDFLKSEE